MVESGWIYYQTPIFENSICQPEKWKNILFKFDINSLDLNSLISSRSLDDSESLSLQWYDSFTHGWGRNKILTLNSNDDCVLKKNVCMSIQV